MSAGGIGAAKGVLQASLCGALLMRLPLAIPGPGGYNPSGGGGLTCPPTSAWWPAWSAERKSVCSLLVLPCSGKASSTLVVTTAVVASCAIPSPPFAVPLNSNAPKYFGTGPPNGSPRHLHSYYYELHTPPVGEGVPAVAKLCGSGLHVSVR